MQVYRGMDIGTAKPGAGELSKLSHHLIDIRNPNEQFTVGDFVRLADEACVDIFRRGKLPVVSGGAGFYLKNFILGLPDAPPSSPEIRAELKDELLKRGAASLMEELAAGDPVSAGRIHINDQYRLLRALEILRISGRPSSSFNAPGITPFSGAGGAKADCAMSGRPQYRFCIIGIARPREAIYRRIDQRCAAMFRQGLPEEVRGLYEAGYTPDDPGLRAIGYREFFIENLEAAPGMKKYRLSNDLAGVEALAAQNSRRYAKRQYTFFASIPDVDWLPVDDNEKETAAKIREKTDVFLTAIHTLSYHL
jgi:tRNA dimethylallyltransferase